MEQPRTVIMQTGALVVPPMDDEEYERLKALIKQASDSGHMPILPLDASFVPMALHLEHDDWLRILKWYEAAWEEGTARDPEHEALYAVIRDHVEPENRS